MRLFSFFKKSVTIQTPMVGRKIRVISCPRRYDNADAYAGWEGVVTSDGEGLEIERQGDSPAVLIICSPGWKKRLVWEYIQ